LFTAFKSSVLKSSEHDGEDAAKKTRAPTAAYNALLSAYSTAAMHDKCEALYSEMLESGIWPNVSTYALLIGSLKEKCDVYKAREYFLDMINRNIKPTMNVYKTLFKIHAEAPENTLANALYDSLIESGDFQQPIDKEILKLLILANSRCGDYAKATAYKNLYDNLQDGGVNNGKGLDEEVIEALMFAASRNIEGEMEMLNYFEKLHEKSAYSYEIIIQYYINKQNLNKAKEYYLRMTIIGFECSWQVRKYFSESTL
jgi:pentatricopeptide repeat protein